MQPPGCRGRILADELDQGIPRIRAGSPHSLKLSSCPLTKSSTSRHTDRATVNTSLKMMCSQSCLQPHLNPHREACFESRLQQGMMMMDSTSREWKLSRVHGAW